MRYLLLYNICCLYISHSSKFTKNCYKLYAKRININLIDRKGNSNHNAIGEQY